MVISTDVIPISNVKMGIKGESTFGTGIDSSGADGTAYRQLPVLQATKPTFNVTFLYQGINAEQWKYLKATFFRGN